MLHKNPFIKWCVKNKDWSELPLRFIIGFMFLMMGIGKLKNPAMISGMLTNLGLPGGLGIVVALVEFVGGLALLAGYLVRHFAATLSVIMIVALFTAHKAALFSLDFMGMGLALMSLAGLLSLMFSGAGNLSMDNKK